MIGIYALFVIDKCKKPIVGKSLLLLLSILILVSRVSIPHIVANTPRSVPGIYHFWISAFLNTRLVVQLVTLIIFAAAVFLFRDLASYLRPQRTSLSL